MKNKGVMISLAALVLIGMMITIGTHNFIEKNSAGGSNMASQVTGSVMDETAGAKEAEAVLMEEMPLVADPEGAADMDGEDTFKDAPGTLQERERSEDSAGIPETYVLTEGYDRGEDMSKEEEPALTSGMKKSAAAISPVETARESDVEQEEFEEIAVLDIVSAESQSYYVKRLQDLDNQIQKNKEGQTGANVNGSMKSAASSELKLWDSELNDIYNAVLDRLGQEESEELVREERAWLKERDSLAMDAAKKSPGGSSESIEYTVSLMESTRQRAYELAERYAQVLEE